MRQIRVFVECPTCGCCAVAREIFVSSLKVDDVTREVLGNLLDIHGTQRYPRCSGDLLGHGARIHTCCYSAGCQGFRLGPALRVFGRLTCSDQSAHLTCGSPHIHQGLVGRNPFESYDVIKGKLDPDGLDLLFEETRDHD